MIVEIYCCDLCKKETKKKNSIYWEESPNYIPAMDKEVIIICKKCWNKYMNKTIKIYEQDTTGSKYASFKKFKGAIKILKLKDIKKNKGWKVQFILGEEMFL